MAGRSHQSRPVISFCNPLLQAYIPESEAEPTRNHQRPHSSSTSTSELYGPSLDHSVGDCCHWCLGHCWQRRTEACTATRSPGSCTGPQQRDLGAQTDAARVRGAFVRTTLSGASRVHLNSSILSSVLKAKDTLEALHQISKQRLQRPDGSINRAAWLKVEGQVREIQSSLRDSRQSINVALSIVNR